MSQLRTISKSAAKTRFTDGTQATDWEKTFAGHASDKRLESNSPVRTGAENTKSMKGHSRKGRRCREARGGAGPHRPGGAWALQPQPRRHTPVANRGQTSRRQPPMLEPSSAATAAGAESVCPAPAGRGRGQEGTSRGFEKLSVNTTSLWQDTAHRGPRPSPQAPRTPKAPVRKEGQGATPHQGPAHLRSSPEGRHLPGRPARPV